MVGLMIHVTDTISQMTVKIGNSAELGSNIFYYQNADFKYTNNSYTK